MSVVVGFTSRRSTAPRVIQTWEPTLHAQIVTRLVALKVSLWVIPTICTVAAVLLAQGLIWLDSQIWGSDRVNDRPFIFAGGVDGAREVLSSISGSLIAVTGTVFSLTIVALQLASGQMTPRLLRDFTGDRQVQIVLGILVGTFTYSILVLRVIRSEDSLNDSFVPQVAVTVAIALALVSVGALIAFIHHLSRLIQVDVVVARTANENLAMLARRDPVPNGAIADPERPAHWPPSSTPFTICARRSGYVQAVDREALFRLCRRQELTVQVLRAPGTFILDQTPMAHVWTRGSSSPATEAEIRRNIVIGDEPTGQADVGFAIRQIVDIALRALSPGINDPRTATACVDRLGQLLAEAGRRPLETLTLRTTAGAGLLVLAPGPDFSTLVQSAFTQIRHYGSDDTLVMAHVVETIATVLAVVPDAAHGPLWQEANRTLATARRSVSDEDRPIIETVAERFASAPVGG